MSESDFDYKQWALAKFKYYREAAVAKGVDPVFALEYAYKSVALAELLAAAGHAEALAAVVIGDVPLGESGVVLSDEKRALDLLRANNYGSRVPNMMCVPLGIWHQAEAMADGGGCCE
jgi:hypothetical protein